MRTAKELYPQTSKVYKCELEFCPTCGGPMLQCDYTSGRKTVQTLSEVLFIAYRPKYCADPSCESHETRWKSANWQQIAPLFCTYGYDVIAQIGWQRQSHYKQFEQIHADLVTNLQISESHVRHLYYQRYLPLLACHERAHLDELQAVAGATGLILTLDGLAPEGGEPQLWIVRELQTGLTVRSGWLSAQSQAAFEHFLQPIADLNLHVTAVMSDKQRGLLPAIASVFTEALHALCQMHYLKNAAEPVAAADETMKVSLRKTVRKAVGDLIRQEQVENPGVLTVTGLIPSPVDEDPAADETPGAPGDPVQQEQAAVVDALKRRVRYLLTLKGRPPLRLAGLEMFERLTEVVACLAVLIAYAPDPRLIQLRAGIQHALDEVEDEYLLLRQVADWLSQITDLLDPEDKPPRTGTEVKTQLFVFLDDVLEQSRGQPILEELAQRIYQTSRNYEGGLFHTYDVPGLPRTNNDRESEFRDLKRRLWMTTGQLGATRRILHRSGAWELIPRPGSFADTVAALSQVGLDAFRQERQRVRSHRRRFRSHTRSVKQSRKLLRELQERWLRLPPDGLSV